jgi:hypothetical protein
MRIFSLKQVEVGLHRASGPSKARGEGRAGPMFPLLLSLGELSLIVAPNASPNVLLVAGRIRGSGFAAIFLGGRGAGGAMVETAVAVPDYSGGAVRPGF